jgi:response regulator RpfG family c-di-GMP phosphodiesterase
MELHPTIGGQVLRRSEEQVKTLGHSIFGIGIEIAECHHEKFDGSGYPHKLKGEEIPLSARIIALADVFDALTSRRPYKEAWPIEKAIEVINDEAGIHFDPLVVAAFNQAMPRLRAVYQQYKHC